MSPVVDERRFATRRGFGAMQDERVIVSVDGVAKSYRQGDAIVRAVAGVKLNVHAGEFVSVMGSSGSGKSTLLHLIGGLDVPDAGEITVAGHRFSAMTDDELTLLRRRSIGFVFQFFNLLPTLSAAENVALPLLLDGKRPREVGPRVDRLLELVGRRTRAHRPDQLGRRDARSPSRALVNEPLLLLADEPTGNLDSRTGERVLRLLQR
jgi:putative ABC transport system ATP-binding protein